MLELGVPSAQPLSQNPAPSMFTRCKKVTHHFTYMGGSEFYSLPNQDKCQLIPLNYTRISYRYLQSVGRGIHLEHWMSGGKRNFPPFSANSLQMRGPGLKVTPAGGGDILKEWGCPGGEDRQMEVSAANSLFPDAGF